MACIEVKVSYNTLSELETKVTQVGGGLSANVHKMGDELLAKVTDLSEKLSASVSCVRETLIPQISRIGDNLKMKCSIICSFDKVADFIDVKPEDIQWITDTQGIYFDVESNVEWIIVVS